ncbi:hypothetical protein FXN63_07020 [Pigmentiphaga aceris]|uniref:Uncharacterized protein n=1 Tax=Pigmentiphaga aceris TaxID=1940612 RepID=A0A5C0ATD7_9BURK|nr:hypothetical protein [Pigmentiphaga aceris]QEI05619.1 hypothetical protein FXN63_07020 [Pigmentiphaga aceris]
MKRIAIAIAGSLIGVSAFAANYGAAQPKPVDFNNGELAMYPAQVQAFEPQQQAAANTQIIIGAAEENVGELAAYPLVPVSVTQLSRTEVRNNALVSARTNAQTDDGELAGPNS